MTFDEALKNMKHENCFNIGTFLKTHANKGQVSAKIHVDLFQLKEESILVEIDNYLVPFFIDFSKCNLDVYPLILKLKNIDDVVQAALVKGKRIFIPKSQVDDIDEILIDFDNFVIGYSITDQKLGFIGNISEYVDDKKNPLFVVTNNDKDALIPVNAIEFLEADHDKKELFVKLPENIVEFL
ncbi:MAG: hypothetical protein JXL97_12475 [Bacteroidales bacterium]|nr:hypothetical protein [Bacteroidales bacterium]